MEVPESTKRKTKKEKGACRFPCRDESCPAGFDRKSDLQRHWRIHTGERPFQCDHCGKAFIQRSALSVHNRVHTGEKPHQCQFPGCEKRFADSSSLARHRRIHTGNRPYRCGHAGCRRTFCRKTSMVNHMKKNHGRDGQQPPGLDNMAFSPGETDSAPSTPASQVAIPWQSQPPAPMMGHPSQPAQRAASFADFGHQMNPYGLPQPDSHRHSVSSGALDGFQNYTHPQQQLLPPQQAGAQMLSPGAGAMPQNGYFVPGQGGPGVTAMNAVPHLPPLPQQSHYQPQMPRQGVGPLPLQIPQMSNVAEFAHSSTPANESPGSVSVASAQSPLVQEGMYTHVQPVQPVLPPPYQVQYQPPVAVHTISSVPGYGAGGVFDPWGQKLDYPEDPSMQMPSQRVQEPM